MILSFSRYLKAPAVTRPPYPQIQASCPPAVLPAASTLWRVTCPPTNLAATPAAPSYPAQPSTINRV